MFTPDCSSVFTGLVPQPPSTDGQSCVSDLPGMGCPMERNDAALRLIQQALSNKPFLQLPDLSRDFFVFTDSSSFAIAGCLAQEYQGKYLPVRFAGRKLSDAEKKYAVGDLEALAVVFSVAKFSRYLSGRPFFICTDHRGLSIMTSGNTPRSRRIHRWSILMSQYQYQLCYIPARLNCLADFVSRQPECLG